MVIFTMIPVVFIVVIFGWIAYSAIRRKKTDDEIERGIDLRARDSLRAVLLGLLTILTYIVGLWVVSGLVTTGIWHDSVGHEGVFNTKLRLMQDVFLIVFWANVAVMLFSHLVSNFFAGRRFRLSPAVALTTFELSFMIAAFVAVIEWQNLAELTAVFDGVKWGQVDQLFGRDWAFYAHVLPMARELLAIVYMLLLVAGFVGLANALVWRVELPEEPRKIRGYGYERPVGIVFSPRQNWVFGFARTLMFWVGVAALVGAAGAGLQKYVVLAGTAGYTTMRTTLPLLNAMVFALVLIGVSLLVTVFLPRTRNPWSMATVREHQEHEFTVAKTMLHRMAVLFGVVALIWLVRWTAPLVVEAVMVSPNRITREEPYAQWWLENTRAAFGLDKLQVIEAQYSETTPILNVDELSTTRAVDWPPIRDAAEADQEFLTAFCFPDADIDRYMVDGRLEQFYVVPREVCPEQIPSQGSVTFDQEHIRYTAGQGVAAVAISQMTPEGEPVYSLGGIPPKGEPAELVPTQTLILHGTNDLPFAIWGGRIAPYGVNAAGNQVELDLTEVMTQPLGIRLNGLTRFIFAVEEGSFGLWRSRNITAESSLLINRQVVERARQITPFFDFDGDPLMIAGQDQYYWLLDAYLTHESLPFVEVFDQVRYMSHPVKVLIGAYDGSVQYFVVDPSDPALKVWVSTFPGLFKPLNEMPGFAMNHMRYPEEIFDTQSAALAEYHLDPADPQSAQILLDGRDKLAPFTETTNSGDIGDVAARYKLETLPGVVEGAGKQEFVITRGFTPLNAKVMTGWLVGRSEADQFGQLVLFRIPKSVGAAGSYEVEERISQQPAFSQQLTLWSNRLELLDGALIGVPIWTVEDGEPTVSFIWVKSYYTTNPSAQRRLPTRVAVAVMGNDAQRLAVGRTLVEALVLYERGGGLSKFLSSAEIDGVWEPEAVPAREAVPLDAELQDLNELQLFERMEDCLSAADFTCFDRYFQELGARLEQEYPARAPDQD